MEKAEKELSRITREKEDAMCSIDKLEKLNLELEADLKNTRRDKKNLEQQVYDLNQENETLFMHEERTKKLLSDVN